MFGVDFQWSVSAAVLCPQVVESTTRSVRTAGEPGVAHWRRLADALGKAGSKPWNSDRDGGIYDGAFSLIPRTNSWLPSPVIMYSKEWV